jgi:ubiquinone biosynthesis protein Coq4
MSLESKTPSEILPKFYADHNLGDEGGMYIEYVTIVFTDWFHLYIPNISSRKKAVFLHDVHHLITGYESVIVGEFEIAGWEIASGCIKYWFAYFINSPGLLMGVFLAPKKTMTGFKRGCRSSNLYLLGLDFEVINKTTIGELKKQVGIDIQPETPYTLQEVLWLIFHLLNSIIIGVIYTLAMPLLLIYNLYVIVKYKLR